MIGIYKITNPKGKVYIGQSIDIMYRFTKYHAFDCKSQIRLYRSLLKHGYDEHLFEILEECLEEELNDKERFYQEQFNVIGRNGLNCRLTRTDDKSGRMSDFTKTKMSISRKKMFENGILEKVSFFENKIHSDESKLKMSISQKKRFKLEKESGKIRNCKRGGLHKDSKKVICTKSGKVWDCIKDCAIENNLNYKTFCSHLSGRYKNNTTFKYLE